MIILTLPLAPADQAMLYAIRVEKYPGGEFKFLDQVIQLFYGVPEEFYPELIPIHEYSSTRAMRW